MRIAVLGASGRVGGLLVDQASEQGHHVVALVRAPGRFTRPPSRQVEVRQADVTSPQDFPAPDDIDVVVSAIGVHKGDGPGALVAEADQIAFQAGADPTVNNPSSAAWAGHQARRTGSVESLSTT